MSISDSWTAPAPSTSNKSAFWRRNKVLICGIVLVSIVLLGLFALLAIDVKNEGLWVGIDVKNTAGEVHGDLDCVAIDQFKLVDGKHVLNSDEKMVAFDEKVCDVEREVKDMILWTFIGIAIIIVGAVVGYLVGAVLAKFGLGKTLAYGLLMAIEGCALTLYVIYLAPRDNLWFVLLGLVLMAVMVAVYAGVIYWNNRHIKENFTPT